MTDILAPTHSFKRGETVFVGKRRERATIKGEAFSFSKTSGFWWPVTFEDGGALSIPEEALNMDAAS